MNPNLDKFGHLVDAGDSGDRKASFLATEDGEVRIEIDTDDCDREHALAFKNALIKLWNEQK